MKDSNPQSVEQAVSIASNQQMMVECDRFFRLSLDLFCIVGFDGYFKRLNPAWEKLLGYSLPELLNIPFIEFLHPADQSEFLNALDRLATGKVLRQLESRYRCRDGIYRWFAWTATPFLQEGTIYAIARDITAQKQTEESLRLSEARLSTIISATSDALVVVDSKGVVQFVNPAAEVLFGRSSLDLINHWLGSLYVFDEPAEVTIVQPNGELVVTEMRAVPLEWKGEKAHLASLRNVTERYRAESALREKEQFLRSIYAGAAVSFFVIDVQQEGDFRYVGINPTYERLTGLSSQHLSGKTPEQVLSPAAAEILHLHCVECVETGETVTYEECLAIQGKEIYLLTKLTPQLDQESRIDRIVGTSIDITDRKQADEQLRHNALYDALTHLPNRTLLIDRMSHTIRRSKRRDNFLFAVLFLDLDRFKVVNDSLGHMIGDQLLVAIARRLEACIRPSDTLARLGGDEFTILLEDIKSPKDAIQVAKRINQALANPFDLNGHEVFTNTSIGIALSTLNYSHPEELLRDADAAMYRAKELGKGRYALFDEQMYKQALARLQLETDLRKAIERQEFRVHYQPILSLTTGRLVGFEALLRWHHPEQGLILPGQFIPLAEETGLIVPIGKWVLERACQQMRTWQEQFSSLSLFTMSVNLSSKQLQEPNLVEQITQILHETGLAHRCLKLEIIENLLMEDATVAAVILRGLEAEGIQLSIDDFGTGHSSLSYLHRFPLHTLKIDRSFISGFASKTGDTEIVRAIISLAHVLGMDVVAEGIETAEQAAQLRALGCELGQGYFFSRPLDSESTTALLSAGLAPSGRG
jgi:diguanylate cyclase (GGDEF)-like protein/PAS domain S-box-containing protein